MTEAQGATGRCFCGAVQFQVPLPSRWCAHCHCSMCRRSHGAAFVTWLGVPRDQFSFTAGESDLIWFQSSKEAQRGFCRHCGSTLFFKSTRWADEMHIALANMDDPIDKLPQAHVYFDTHVPWLTLSDNLPHLGGETGIEPLD